MVAAARPIGGRCTDRCAPLSRVPCTNGPFCLSVSGWIAPSAAAALPPSPLRAATIARCPACSQVRCGQRARACGEPQWHHGHPLIASAVAASAQCRVRLPARRERATGRPPPARAFPVACYTSPEERVVATRQVSSFFTRFSWSPIGDRLSGGFYRHSFFGMKFALCVPSQVLSREAGAGLCGIPETKTC